MFLKVFLWLSFFDSAFTESSPRLGLCCPCLWSFALEACDSWSQCFGVSVLGALGACPGQIQILFPVMVVSAAQLCPASALHPPPGPHSLLLLPPCQDFSLTHCWGSLLVPFWCLLWFVIHYFSLDGHTAFLVFGSRRFGDTWFSLACSFCHSLNCGPHFLICFLLDSLFLRAVVLPLWSQWT